MTAPRGPVDTLDTRGDTRGSPPHGALSDTLVV